MQLQHGWFERVIDNAERIQRFHDVVHVCVDKSGWTRSGLLQVQEPRGDAVHGCFDPRLRSTWSIASALRAASVVARAVSVAPVTGWMPRFNADRRSAAVRQIGDTSDPEADNPGGSRKATTSTRNSLPCASMIRSRLSFFVLTTCVSR